MIKDKQIIHLFYLSFVAVIIVFLLIACNGKNNETIIVTEVVVVEGEEQIITRVVRQTVTPSSITEDRDFEDPIELDVNFSLTKPPELDPQTADSDESNDLIENLFVGLTKYNHQTNQVEPELAANWDITQNGRVWTFHLRNDVFWIKPTDQTASPSLESIAPVVADDIVLAIQRACARVTNTPDVVVLFVIEGCEQVHTLANPKAADLNRIGAVALNDTTLQITLTKPSSNFLTITTLLLMRPVPKMLIEEFGADWTEPENLLTSGPFFPNSAKTTLYKNSSWPFQDGQGNVEIVNIIYLTDPNDAMQLWNAKQLDLVVMPDSEDIELSERTLEKRDLNTGQTVFYYAFNFDSGVFREPAIREAFSAAIDREVLVEEIYGEQAVVMQHLLPPGVIGAPPITEVGIGYDPDYARIQMQDSGFRSCRLMPPIRLLVTSSDQSLRQAELIRKMWIDELKCTEDQIIIEQAQFGTLLANTRRDAGAVKPDVWELGWASYYPDAHNWFGDLLHCIDSENRQNRNCSDVDDLIRQASTVMEHDARVELYREIENLFFSRGGILPMAPLYVPGVYVLSQNWLEYTPALFGGEQYDTYIINAELKRLERSR
ncbi:MAG: hypothetical protein GY943_02000 [Chloroflexi bacterium]|nr:hypothetical protein [Chloroflexota bacterium]